MSFESDKVLLGATGSNIKEVNNHTGSSTTFPAGTVVRLKSDDTLSTSKADGGLLGVSLGRNLSNTTYDISICRKGIRVPVLLAAGFSPNIGSTVSISDTTGLATTAATGATSVNATYSSSAVSGITESGAYAQCALIDFQGGL